MKKIVLILDLDGVLITTPIWKADEMDFDNYSKFNKDCIDNLNELLSLFEIDIWLSSTRRTVKTLTEFNLIFENRKIKQSIIGFLPQYQDCKNRKEEILKFIHEFNISSFLIIDDDKSLNELEEQDKQKLVLTQLPKGFSAEQLQIAVQKITLLK